MARRGYSKFYYELTVRADKTLLPSDIRKALAKMLEGDPFADYPYRSLLLVATGKVEKKGEEYVFTPRGSKQGYTLDFEEAPKELSGRVIVTGFVEEPEGEEGKKKPRPVIEVEAIKKPEQ